MGGRILRVVVWSLGTVLALSGLSLASTGGLGSPAEEPAASEAPATLEVQDPVVLQQSEEPPVQDAQEGSGDEDGSADAPVWSTEGCPEGFTGNHGQYVSSVERSGEARSAAAKSPCGKPLNADGEEPSQEGDEESSAMSSSSDGSDKGAGRTGRRGPPEGKGRGPGAAK